MPGSLRFFALAPRGKMIVLLIVTVKAQELPVAAIRRVVIVVMVFVVHGELAQIVFAELPPASAADPGEEPKRLLPETPHPQVMVLPRGFHRALEAICVHGLFANGHKQYASLKINYLTV